jgi:hypothetical protein
MGAAQRGSFESYVGLWFLMRASVLLESGYGGLAIMNALRALRHRRRGLKTFVFIALGLVPTGPRCWIMEEVRKRRSPWAW